MKMLEREVFGAVKGVSWYATKTCWCIDPDKKGVSSVGPFQEMNVKIGRGSIAVVYDDNTKEIYDVHLKADTSVSFFGV